VTSQEAFFWEECCSGVAPHLSDGSSAIGTVLFKSKKLSWLVTPNEYRSEWRTHYSTINRSGGDTGIDNGRHCSDGDVPLWTSYATCYTQPPRHQLLGKLHLEATTSHHHHRPKASHQDYRHTIDCHLIPRLVGGKLV
jgi:hypothetical protein